MGPGLAAAADAGLYERTGYLSLQGWEEWWLISIGTLEGKESSGRAGQGIVLIFHPWKLLGPQGWILGDRAT